MQTSQCLSDRSLQERREGLEAFQTSLSRVRRRRMKRRRRRMMMRRRRWRGRGGMKRILHDGGGHDRQNFSWTLFPLLHLLLQGSLQQEEVKQPHRRYTQKPNLNYLVTPEAPDHLPLATLPCFPERCNHCGKSFSTHIGGPWSHGYPKNTTRQIPGQVDGTQKDQLCHMLHRLQD